MLDQVVSTFLFAFASFIPVLNPFGGAMFFLALTPNIDQETRKMMVNRIVFYSMIIMLISLFAGHLILSFFGISMGVLRVGGGLVLISAGWKALNEAAHDDTDNSNIEPPKSRKKITLYGLLSDNFASHNGAGDDCRFHGYRHRYDRSWNGKLNRLFVGYGGNPINGICVL